MAIVGSVGMSIGVSYGFRRGSVGILVGYEGSKTMKRWLFTALDGANEH